jgi:hypothetical protein
LQQETDSLNADQHAIQQEVVKATMLQYYNNTTRYYDNKKKPVK